jgi:OOP family OmpA-OmpF porin
MTPETMAVPAGSAVPVDVQNRTLRAGIIGLGAGRAHMRGYQDAAGVEVFALAGKETERLDDLASGYGAERTYTDWQDNYPVALYDRDKVGAGLAGVRDKGAGPTPLRNGLRKLDTILSGLTGRSAVFLFWDGEFTGPDPVKDALEIAHKHDVCFYVVSSAKPKREAELAHNVATINNCSRVIPLADFFAHPEYTSAALWDVKVTEHPVPTNELNFTFNGIDLGADDEAHLDKIAAFMAEHKDVHLVAAGYTDDVGSRDYNEGLSKKRAEMVGNYLKSKGVEESRMVLLWYGLTNPIVPNDSDENRAKNRRVEIKLSLAE